MTRFSICLPVRNGWPYVKECVESILGQTYPHFELNVLDNHSGDETVPWLKSLSDPRIRLWSSSEPLSIVASWARIKNIEKQDYVTLIGHDDVLDPGFLAAIKALIDRYPDAGLYQTGARLIDSNGNTIRSCRPVPEHETAAQYLGARFKFERDIFGTGFVMRSADYDRLGGIPGFEKLFFADDALWLSLLRNSYKAASAEEQFAVRIHPGSESASLPSAWSSILIALGQFNEFLGRYVDSDRQSAEVTQRLGPDFMLGYHRNAYIFALVEASQAGRKIAPETDDRIRRSLAHCAPSAANKLLGSVKVRLVAWLNATPLRLLVPPLWTVYCRVKNRTR